MRVQILGSAAAEAVPALWCECEYCAFARKNGGKDLRRRTSYWIDDDTLVDFGPDAFSQSVEFGIDLTKIARILFTHAHEDHLNPIDLEWRRQYFSKVTGNIKLYGPQAIFDHITREVKLEIADIHATPVALTGGETVEDGDLRISPIVAAHDPTQLCLNYVIERGGKALLIANDTGWWSDESWARIANFKLDGAIIESTFALFPGNLDMQNGHLGANASRRFRDKLLELGALKPEAKVAVNHFSHNGNPYQSEMEKFFSGTGIKVGYDGKVIEL